jgi:hypothetical protein
VDGLRWLGWLVDWIEVGRKVGMPSLAVFTESYNYM